MVTCKRRCGNFGTWRPEKLIAQIPTPPLLCENKPKTSHSIGVPPGKIVYRVSAMASTSTSTFLGRVFTATQERAGQSPVKNLA